MGEQEPTPRDIVLARHFTEGEAVEALGEYGRSNGKPSVVSPAALVALLEDVSRTGTIRSACGAHGIRPSTLATVRKARPEVEELMEQALELYRERVRLAVHQRAIEGWLEPVFYQGEHAGYIRKYSDKMLALQAKRHCPEYRERQEVDVNVRGGVLVVPVRGMSRAEPIPIGQWVEETRRLTSGQKPDDDGNE